MVREIKFRAWLKDEKRMIDVRAIDFDDDGNIISVNYPEGKSYSGYDGDNIELIQYTGVKDKNGVEIYEGNIVKITIKGKTTVAQVKWLEKRCKFIFVCGEDWIGLEYFQIRNELEVIGNFYENKELLENE